MKAPLSVCIIVKNNELCLEQCILSFKDYVEHIVIVDTGSTDKTIEIAKKYATVFEIFTECNNDRGEIESFALARNKAFELAPTNAVCWVDSDDIIVGAEKFNTILQSALDYQKSNNCDCVTYLFKYEYAYNENNQVILEHYRERLFTNKNYITVVNPVHECIIPKENAKMTFVINEEIVYKHRRQYFKNNYTEPGRNLRILKKYYEKVGDSDARQLYYLGLEYCNNGLIDESIKYLIKYIDISGWEDEKVCACLKLVEIYHILAFRALGKKTPEEVNKFVENLKIALTWAFKAIEIKENWGEGYLALSKIFYFLAETGGPNEFRNWEKCVYFGEQGLKLPPTKTLLFINPLDREYEIHKFLNMAYNRLGRVKDALNSAVTGLKAQPNDLGLAKNKELFEDFLARQQIVNSANILKQNKSITSEVVETIGALINNQPTKNVFDIKLLPANLSNEQLEMVIMLLWKQYMLQDKIEDGMRFLNNAPIKTDGTKEALLLSENALNKQRLNIIFYIGNGLETWSPDTVKKTGIGGSELIAIEMAKRLAKLGNNVSVYSSCGNDNVYEDVKYYTSDKFHNLECDILIVSRRANYLSNSFNIKTKLKLLWVHDVFALDATNELLLKADKILALSEWHKQNLMHHHNLHQEHILVTRNGIDLERFNKNVTRNRFKCVNSSSPDRSWPVLLEVWPEIKKQVPQAELHLFYGFENWKTTAKILNEIGQLELITFLEKKIEEMKSIGVVFHGRVNQEKLAEEFLSAGAQIYPTWFSETSCQLAGSLIFTKNGMKQIENIVVGDMVLTHRGRFRKVTKLIKKQYFGNIYEIKRKKDINPIILTEEHPILTCTYHKRSDSLGGRVHSDKNLKIYWETPNNLKSKINWLVSPRMEFGTKTEIKISDYIDMPVINDVISRNHNNKAYKKVKNTVELTKEFCYLLGLFAAEGCVSSSRKGKYNWYSSVTFALNKKETNLISKIEKYFGKCSIYNPYGTNGITVSFYCSVWANFLKKIIGTGRDKKIPEFIWECAQELQLAFINGIIDGDGSKSNTKRGNFQKNYSTTQYTSISPSLMYGIAQLLANQGIYPGIYYNNKRDNYDLSWSPNVKHPQHRAIENGFATKITSINIKQYNGLVYNFEVDEDESYVTDRTIVHNCISAMEAQAAGLRIVTSNIAALKETVGKRGILLDGEWTSKKYQQEFIKNVVAALTVENNFDRTEVQKYAKEHFCLDKLANEWQEMFLNLLKTNSIIPYQPTIPYRKSA